MNDHHSSTHEYRSTRLRTNSPTTCQLAYVGEFTQVMYAFYHFMLSFCEQCPKYFSFGSAVDERTRNKLYGVNVEFKYLTARVARQWMKERGITHFTQL